MKTRIFSIIVMLLLSMTTTVCAEQKGKVATFFREGCKDCEIMAIYITHLKFMELIKEGLTIDGKTFQDKNPQIQGEKFTPSCLHGDCKALTSGDDSKCDTTDCKFLAKGGKEGIGSIFARALATNNPEMCGNNKSCKAIVKGDPSLCPEFNHEECVVNNHRQPASEEKG